MEHRTPMIIHSTKATLKDDLLVSIRTDRIFILECGRNVVLFLSPDETRLLLEYLVKHRLYFQVKP